MKQLWWLLVCILIILTVLYSRVFFLQEKSDVQDKNEAIQSTLALPAPSNASPFVTEGVFPAKSEPLILPAMTYPPFTMQNESGKWMGADNEIIETVLRRLGYQVQWIEMPFARALEEMKSGMYPAMSACVEGGGREKYIYFSEPVSSIFSVLWKKAGVPFSWTSYNDLKGLVIGASHYHYGAGFFEAAKARKFELDMVAAKKPEIIHFRKLLQGKTDMFICELSVGSYLKEEYKPEFEQVVPMPTGVGPARPFSFAISRKYFEGREEQMLAFVKAFNQELLTFSKSGGRMAIFDKYNMPIEIDTEGRIIIPVQ